MSVNEGDIEMRQERGTQGMLLPPEEQNTEPNLFDSRFLKIFDAFQEKKHMQQIPSGNFLVTDLGDPHHSTIINRLNPQKIERIVDPDYPGDATFSAIFITGVPESTIAFQSTIRATTKLLRHQPVTKRGGERCGAVFGTVPKGHGVDNDTILHSLQEAGLVAINILKGRDDKHPYSFEARLRSENERQGDTIEEIFVKKPHYEILHKEGLAAVKTLNPDATSVSSEELLARRIKDYRSLGDRLRQGTGLIVTFKCGTQWKVGSPRPMTHCQDSGCEHEQREPQYPAVPDKNNGQRSDPSILLAIQNPNRNFTSSKVCDKCGDFLQRRTEAVIQPDKSFKRVLFTFCYTGEIQYSGEIE